MVLSALSGLPLTAAVTTLTETIEASRFAALAAQGVPNPITASTLTTALGLALSAVADVAEEADQEAESSSSGDQSSTSTLSSTTSSSSEPPEPSSYIITFSSKWPDVVVDAFADAFPDDGDGFHDELDGFGMKTYITNITDELAAAINWLPIFDLILPNRVWGNGPDVQVNLQFAGYTSDAQLSPAVRDSALEESRDWGDAPHVDNPRNTSGTTNSASTLAARVPSDNSAFTFPVVSTNIIEQNRDLPIHLPFISENDLYLSKYPTLSTWPYIFDYNSGQGSRLFIVDTGFGPVASALPSSTVGRYPCNMLAYCYAPVYFFIYFFRSHPPFLPHSLYLTLTPTALPTPPPFPFPLPPPPPPSSLPDACVYVYWCSML